MQYTGYNGRTASVRIGPPEDGERLHREHHGAGPNGVHPCARRDARLRRKSTGSCTKTVDVGGTR
ncbi:MAG: hypothetical protein QM820_39755 [Minicystis sp.]